MKTNENLIRQFLNRLGICPSYKGYPYLTRAIYTVMSEYSCQCPVMKKLYHDIAVYFHVSSNSVQYNIRTVLETHWAPQNLQRFISLTGYVTDYGPTPKEFIAIAANYLRQADERY